MRRLTVGLDIGADPVDFSRFTEEADAAKLHGRSSAASASASSASDREFLAAKEKHVVKVLGYDDANALVGQFTGFMYSAEPFVVTAGHAMGFGSRAAQAAGAGQAAVAASSGAKSFVIHYGDGMEEPATVAVLPSPAGVDVMVLKGSRGRELIAAATVNRGDVVYLLGCDSGSTEVSFSKGMVSFTGMGEWLVSTHADHGWKGGPVFNTSRKLVGVLTGYSGERMHLARFTPALRLHDLLVAGKLPGLKA